jgi:hypothetical protein
LRPGEIGMDRRQFRTIKSAIEYSRRGGQAIYLHQMLSPSDPDSFFGAVASGWCIATVFDRDLDRLKFTARFCGVPYAIVHREGTDGQHIKLCGAPLTKLLLHVPEPRWYREALSETGWRYP